MYKDRNVICHHGIEGQKWGIRRYQNNDGTYTSAGKERKYEHVEQNKASSGLTRREKRILIGAGITMLTGPIGLAIYAGVICYKNHKEKSVKNIKNNSKNTIQSGKNTTVSIIANSNTSLNDLANKKY